MGPLQGLVKPPVQPVVLIPLWFGIDNLLNFRYNINTKYFLVRGMFYTRRTGYPWLQLGV